MSSRAASIRARRSGTPTGWRRAAGPMLAASRSAQDAASRRRRAGATSIPARPARSRSVPGDRLLETTDLPIGVVARHSGMVTATNLRKHFGAVVRTTPQAYRDAFRSRGDRLGRHSVG